MEDCCDDRDRKRGRDENSFDSCVDLPELKMKRVESTSGSGGLPESEPNQIDSDDEANSSGLSVNSSDSGLMQTELLNSPEAKRLQDDLLNVLEETESVPDRDLDSVIRSYEEEILIPGSGPVSSEPVTGLGEIPPDLGYLQEASDDELGLPPTGTSGNEKSFEEGIESAEVVPEAMIFNGFMWFEDEIPSYDTLELRLGAESEISNIAEFVAFDGLFEYYPEPGDGLWRYE